MLFNIVLGYTGNVFIGGTMSGNKDSYKICRTIYFFGFRAIYVLFSNNLWDTKL